jgi:hypothetical protein
MSVDGALEMSMRKVVDGGEGVVCVTANFGASFLSVDEAY